MESEQLERTIQAILARNARVEAEKAWEVSKTRRLSILAMTYVIISLFLWLLNIPYFFLEAIVPTVGYLFSTLSLPWIKAQWMRRQGGKN